MAVWWGVEQVERVGVSTVAMGKVAFADATRVARKAANWAAMWDVASH